MYELNNESVVSQDLATVQRQLLESEDVIRTLRNQLEFATGAVVSWDNRFKKITASLNEFVEEQEIVEGSPLSDYLIEEFDLEMTKTVDVVITAKFSARITIPRDADVEDYADYLDMSDDVSLSKGELECVNFDDVSIEEA